MAREERRKRNRNRGVEKGKELTSWKAKLAAEAEEASAMEASSSGGQFFSLRAGQLSWNDEKVKGNHMAVIILDSIFETVYYGGEYDPDVPQNPIAFAFGRDEKEMRWHENSHPDFAGELCSESEVCQWGSADKGKGKAARETRRLGLIPAGQLDRDGGLTELFEDPDHYKSAQVGFMRLPVTSLKEYSNYVRKLAGGMKLPPFAVVTRIYLEPDPKTQFKVHFECLEEVSEDLLESIMERREEVKEMIDFPYPPYEEGEEKEKAPKKEKRKRRY